MAEQERALEETLAILAQHANDADASPTWPERPWEALRQSGIQGWSIPDTYGGGGLSTAELLAGYETLAGACLTTCFILSQREAACRRIRDSGNAGLCRQLLPALACGDSFATVGLSHLTTSRQHLKPDFQARAAGDTFLLSGTLPWVTGAAKSNYIVTGAQLDEGFQILAILPTDLPGVSVEPPLSLMALEGSLTAEVRCTEVKLDRKWLLN